MTRVFTRDSTLLYLGLAGAIITYLLAAPTPPTEWSYREWLQSALLVVTWLVGKLQTSPLPHSVEGGAKVTASGK